MNTDLHTMKNKVKLKLSSKGQVAFCITIIAVIVVIGGYWYYGREKEQIIQQKERTLTAIATLKAKQIELWYKEEFKDAQIISANPWLGEVANTFVGSNSPVDSISLLELLKQIQLEHEYDEVILTSLDGNLIASTNSHTKPIHPDELSALKIAIQKGEAVSTDFFTATQKGNKQSLISFISLINSPNHAIILRIDAANDILPIIESWPTESQTGESFIFSNETNNILFISETKHQVEIETRDKLIVKDDDLLSKIYTSGQPGIFQGKDYRNVDVLASMSKIEGTNCVLIAKVDKSELLQELTGEALSIIAWVLLLVALSGLFIAYWFNTRQKNIYKGLLEKEQELWLQQEKFNVVVDSIGEGIITVDLNGNIQFINNRAEALTGWNLREALGMDFHKVYNVINEVTGHQENNILDKVLKKGLVKELGNQTLLISKSGTSIPVRDTGAPLFDASGKVTGIVISFQDETEKRQQRRLLEESEERYRSTLDSMMEGYQIISRDWRFLFINKAAELHNRRPNEELIGNKFMEIWPGVETTEVFAALKKCMDERVQQHMENEFTFPEGEKRWFSLNIEPIPEGISIMSSDITKRRHDENEIRKNDNFFRLIFANSPDVLFLQDCNLTYTFTINPAHPLTPEGVIGKSDWDLLPPAEAKALTEFKKKIIETGNPVRQEICVSPGGIPRWYDVIYQPIFDSDGQKTGIASYSRDITERKLAEKELIKKDQLLSSVMETQQELICRLLPDTTLTFVNKAYCNVIGRNENELLGTKCLELIPKNEWESIISGLRNLNADNPSHTYISSAIRPDGSVISLEWTDTAILNDQSEVVEFQSVGRDITEKLKAEQELIKAKEKAEESDKLKTAFINNISHEIRTPLNGILGFGGLLAEMELSAEEKEEMLAHVHKSSDRLMNTVSDYMDMAMIFSGTIEMRKKVFSLQPLFEKITENTKQLAVEKKIDFKAETPIEPSDFSMHADPEIIQKIMSKLLDNAFKFTQQGTIICGYRMIPGFVEFFVQDTGQGIAQDKLEMIFDIFTQEDPSMTRGYEGSGLGLTIARGLVNLLGGTMSVTSEKGKGSIFTFTVPYRETVVAEKSVALDDKNDIVSGKPLVLIAEDDELSCKLIAKLLKQAGCDYLQARNGLEAVELCKQHQAISLVLMDIKMPVMNGLEATKLIREFRPKLPIIAITAHAQTGDEPRFLAAGCDGYISKPFSKDKLFKLLQKHI